MIYLYYFSNGSRNMKSISLRQQTVCNYDCHVCISDKKSTYSVSVHSWTMKYISLCRQLRRPYKILQVSEENCHGSILLTLKGYGFVDEEEEFQFPLQWICTDVSKGNATERWQDNWLKLNVLWKHKLWCRQAYHQDLRPRVYTLSRVRQTIVEKVYLFFFSDCVQEWTFLKRRKRNKALYNMAVIYLSNRSIPLGAIPF